MPNLVQEGLEWLRRDRTNSTPSNSGPPKPNPPQPDRVNRINAPMIRQTYDPYWRRQPKTPRSGGLSGDRLDAGGAIGEEVRLMQLTAAQFNARQGDFAQSVGGKIGVDARQLSEAIRLYMSGKFKIGPPYVPGQIPVSSKYGPRLEVRGGKPVGLHIGPNFTARIWDQHLAIKVEKAYLQNIDTGELVHFLLNPAELTETLKINYAKLSVMGHSHSAMQFVGCENLVIPLKAYYDEVTARSMGVAEARGGNSVNSAENWRRFLMSLSYGRKGDTLKTSGAPPVLFYWPGIFSLMVNITNLEFSHSMFQAGTPNTRAYTAQIELTETPQSRIYSEDVRLNGTMRYNTNQFQQTVSNRSTDGRY